MVGTFGSRAKRLSRNTPMRAHRALLQMAHELQRVAERGMHVAAEQRGERLAAAVEVDHVELRCRSTSTARSPPSRRWCRRWRSYRSSPAWIFASLTKSAAVFHGASALHEEHEVVEHHVHHRLHFGQRLRLRGEDRRDLRGAVDQHQRVRIGLAARRSCSRCPTAPPPPGLFTSATGTGTSFSSVDDLVDDARHQVGAAARPRTESRTRRPWSASSPGPKPPK